MTLEVRSGIATTAALVASTLGLVAEARAEVWEYDRSGKLIERIGSSQNETRNKPYDLSIVPATVSTRNTSTLASIYRPMAEGVSVLFAEDPVVLAAGLDPDEFTRLFVAMIDQESRFNPRAGFRTEPSSGRSSGSTRGERWSPFRGHFRGVAKLAR